MTHDINWSLLPIIKVVNALKNNLESEFKVVELSSYKEVALNRNVQNTLSILRDLQYGIWGMAHMMRVNGSHDACIVPLGEALNQILKPGCNPYFYMPFAKHEDATYKAFKVPVLLCPLSALTRSFWQLDFKVNCWLYIILKVISDVNCCKTSYCRGKYKNVSISTFVNFDSVILSAIITNSCNVLTAGCAGCMWEPCSWEVMGLIPTSAVNMLLNGKLLT